MCVDVAHLWCSEVIEPNTQTPIFTSTEPKKRKSLSSEEGKGETAQDAPNKDVFILSDPTALPLEKKRKIETEETVNPFVSSQKDTDLKMAHKLSLEPLSQ